MSQILCFHSKNNPDSIFLHDGRTGNEYSFEKINKLVNKSSNYLLSEGIKSGEKLFRVITPLPNFLIII